ncbi:MAG TPA: FecR domain-containing protein, partial [Reyranella sp.]|nr:FecR domain-containing protein [Reyranella sp.]
GIDVQANEVVRTNAADRAHLVFLDGTSITVGPNAQLTLDKFVYDPNTKKGELAINASKGVFRIVGGRISKTNAISVTTPSSTIGIRGGIALFNVSNVQTTSAFVFGQSLTVTGGGSTQTLTRPGTQVVTNFGGTPGNPTPVPPGSLNGTLGTLEGNSGAGGTGTGGNADQQSQNSGFSNQNSGQGPTNPPPTTTTTTTTTTQNQVTNAVSGTNDQEQTDTATPVTTRTTTTTTTETTNTKVIVTKGRFLEEKPFKPNTFNANTLRAKRDKENNQALNPSGTAANTTTTVTTTVTDTTTVGGAVTNQTSTSTSTSTTGPTTATISAPSFGSGGSSSQASEGGSGGSIAVPWRPGEIFQFTVESSLGPANGLGLVTANQNFFAYTFVVTSGAYSGQRFGLFGGEPTTVQNFPKVGVGAQTLTNLVQPGGLPFAPEQVNNDSALVQAAKVSPLYSVFTENLSGQGTAVPGGMQVSLSIAGSGSSQKSYMGVFITNYGTDSATNTLYSAGTSMDSYRLGGNQRIGRGVANQATADTGPGNGTAIYGETGQYQVYVPDKITTRRMRHGDGDAAATESGGRRTRRTHQAALDQAQANATPTPYYPVTMATPVAEPNTLPPDLGQKRTTQTMNGYVGGLIESRNGNTFSTRLPNVLFARPTDVTITTDAAKNQAKGTIVIRGADGSLFSPNTKLTLELGGKTTRNGPTSAFIDDSRYAMVSTNERSRSSSVEVNGSNKSITNNTMLASYNSAPVTLPGGVTPCTCEYLSWGFWGSNINYTGSYRNGQTDNIHMGTYVVGQVTNALQMPQTGTATYSGHMIGNVRNGSNNYVGTGTFNLPWSYAARAGTFNANFDGTSYNGLVAAKPGSGGVDFAGAFAGPGFKVGALSGSFFNSPGMAAAYVGGAFGITNLSGSYQASGIFAGQR